MMAFALTGTKVFDGECIREGLAVVVEGERVADLVSENALGGARRVRLDGGFLAPGFIDVQVNGGGGALLNGAPTVETVRRIAQSHRKFGTTGLLPTVITDAPEVMRKAVAAVKQSIEEGVPGVLGIHIEGPFLDVKRKGGHAEQFIRAMTNRDAADIAAIDCGSVMVTVAPNRAGPEFIRLMAEKGVLISLGHSEASYDEALSALAAGARAFTHLYNAMSQMTGREPGMVGAALSDRESYCGLIADGHHVHHAAMKVALAAKLKGRLMLISDAMPTAAGGPDSFALQGRTVRRAKGRLQLEDGTLAGSNLTMDEALRYVVKELAVPLEDALRMASLNPASFVRREQELGRIAHGYLASLVHLGEDLNVRQTWINGR